MPKSLKKKKVEYIVFMKSISLLRFDDDDLENDDDFEDVVLSKLK